MSGIVQGTQPAIDKGKERVVTHPKNKFFGWKYLRPAVSRHCTVLRMMPQRFHRVGPEKDALILEDIELVYTVFATVEPEAFDQFEKEQWALYQAEQDASDPTMIQIPIWLKEKMDCQKRVMTLKGKMGKIIANRDRTERLKRKRQDALLGEVEQRLIDDVVYLPPDDMMSTEVPSVNKKYVPIEDYLGTQGHFNTLKNQVTEYNDDVLRSI